VHRNISPATLLVRHSDRALFTGFDISRVPGAETIGHAIAMPSTDAPWLAPELIANGFGAANASTDVFALCRTLQTAFLNTDDAHAILERGVAQRLTAKQLRDEILNLADVAIARTAVAPQVPSAEYWSEGTVVEFRDHHYRVAQRLGTGGMGMTYRVVQVIGADQDGAAFVAKTARSDHDARRLIESYALARPVTDMGLARMHEFVASDRFALNSFVALLEYLPGYSLSEYRGIVAAICDERSESLREPMVVRDQIEQWLRSLLGALSAMHRNGCVHGDVSAANIIVRPEQSYTTKLTDFDLVTRVGQTLASSGTPRYCAPESRAGEAARASYDVYALAAVLFDVAFARDPFDGRGKETGIVWGSGEREMLGRIAEFLDQATHPDPSQRFGDADAALRWLDMTANASVEPVARSEAPVGVFRQQEIPWLRDLLSTYPASFVGNAETRGLESPFARDTYVETDLDRHVADELRAGKAQLVILCGNAGDGKTAFLQKLAEKFGLPNVHSAQRLWKHTLSDGRRMLLNLDGAAAWGARSADDLMDEVMQPFRDGRPQPELLHLVAVNNGRLLEWIEQSGESRLTNYLRSVLLGDEIKAGDEIAHVRYIDLNERSLVGSADEANADEVPRFIDELIDRMSGASAAQTWAPCATCSAQARCTARRSMTALEVPARRTRIVKQLSRALQAVHQRGRVHITTRELRGALTYIFFGVHYCTDLHADPSLEPASYWDRAFDAESLRRQGDVLGELVTLDPALDSHPILDRELRRMARREGDAAGLGSLRRRAYFEATDDELKKMARSEGALPLFCGAHYGEFARVGEMDKHEMFALVRKLCAGIAQLETLPNIVLNRLDAGMVPLKILPRTPIESVFWVEKKLERFSLRAETPHTSEPIDWLPNRAALEYEYGDGRRETLWMSSALFALLLEVADGNRLMGEASRDTFANLSIFTQRLAEEQATELFAWEPTKDRAVHRIWIDRSEVAGGGRQLLRLEEVSRG
jgi:serine/threonine protein kinase